MSRTMTLATACAGLMLMSCVGNMASTTRQADDGGDEADEDGGTGSEADGAGPGQRNDGGSAGDGGGEGSGDGGVASGRDASVGKDPPVVPVLHDCTGLAADGVFEDITPPEVKAGIGSVPFETGTFAIAVDPVNQGTLYVGTRVQKFWKTTDCGATWKHISTGRNGSAIDSGMNWTVAVDPQDPQIVYTNAGYGTNALYKSPNGGVDWDPIWPPPSQPELADAFEYNFTNVIALDPGDHEHLLLTFNETCRPPHTPTCIAESMNGGASWRLLDGRPEWNGNEGQVIFFMESSSSWLWGSQENGFWRSTNSGGSWRAIEGMTTTHLQGSQLTRANDGTFYMAAGDGIWRSPDGEVSTWRRIPSTGSILGGLVNSGSTLFASTCYFPNFCDPQYLRSPQDNGQTWTPMNGPALDQGGTMAYDLGHHLLYSSNLLDGLWRVVAR